MRKRDDAKNRRETVHAIAMILQIALAVMTCMGLSLGIGYYVDKLFHTSIWFPIMMIVGIMASIRSMLVLTGRFTPGASQNKTGDTEQIEKGNTDADIEENSG